VITLQGKEGIRINPIYVDDAVVAMANIIKIKENIKINIGGAETLSIKSISDIISRIVGKLPNYKFEDVRVNNVIGDISKMKALLHTPLLSFESAIKKMVANG
jgi:UDP-glucose 4-epimerase